MNIKSASKLVLLSAILLNTVSCVEQDLGDGTANKNTPVEKTEVNDFATQSKVTVAVNYESKASFEIYATNPLTYVEETGLAEFNSQMSGKSIYTRSTQDDGSFTGEATLPASVIAQGKVYIYSSGFNTPTLYVAKIENGAINADITYKTANNSLLAEMNSSKQARDVIVNGDNTGFVNRVLFPNMLGNIGANGVPLDYADEANNITVDQTMKDYLNYNLPEGGTDKRYESFVNNSNELDGNDIHVSEDAHINFNFVGGTTSARSAIGYYCYNENATVADIEAAKSHACLIFANARVADLTVGLSVKLKYIKPDGTLGNDVFPKGTVIGFMLQNNGWKGGNGTKDGIAYNKTDVFYSTKVLNYDKKPHTASLAIKDANGEEHNVISFEDWNSGIDYNDIAFSIKSDPIEAIVVTPAKDPTAGVYSQTFKGVLAFEDNWPRAVDFDLNDVILKYNSVLSLNDDNKVVKIEDTFTLVWSGANESNGFGYQIPILKSNIESVTCDNQRFVGLSNKSDKATIILFNDAKSQLGLSGVPIQDMSLDNPPTASTFTVTTTLKTPVDADKVIPPYNPFIVNCISYEVHLTGYAPAITNRLPFGTSDDASDGVNTFYVYTENNYPFAIHMDARANDDIMSLATSLRGEVRITKKFPKFADWATTRDPLVIWWK